MKKKPELEVIVEIFKEKCQRDGKSLEEITTLTKYVKAQFKAYEKYAKASEEYKVKINGAEKCIPTLTDIQNYRVAETIKIQEDEKERLSKK